MSQFSLFLKIALTKSSLRRGCCTALVVGTLLNIINIDFDSPTAFLFLVSIYSATAARLRFDPGVRAAAHAQLVPSI